MRWNRTEEGQSYYFWLVSFKDSKIIQKHCLIDKASKFRFARFRFLLTLLYTNVLEQKKMEKLCCRELKLSKEMKLIFLNLTGRMQSIAQEKKMYY